MTESNSETKAKPDITKVEYNFLTEDDLRRDSRGQTFEHMQDSEIEFVHADRRVATEDGNVAVRIWFENGAHMRYELIDEHTVVEATYRPDDPSSVYDYVPVKLSRGGRDEFVACVEDSIREYLVSRRETVEDFKDDWSTVYEVLR
jgi:hypothetical protein